MWAGHDGASQMAASRWYSGRLLQFGQSLTVSGTPLLAGPARDRWFDTGVFARLPDADRNVPRSNPYTYDGVVGPGVVYAPSVRWALQLSPLYHGTALLRTMAAGRFVLADVGHIAFLLAMVVAGLLVVTRRLSAKLLA